MGRSRERNMGGRCAREGERSVREEDSRRWAASRGVDWEGSRGVERGADRAAGASWRTAAALAACAEEGERHHRGDADSGTRR